MAAPGDRFEVRIDKYLYGGLCRALLPDSEVTLVTHAIPGERCMIELSYRKRKLWFSTVVEVLEPADSRREAPCPYAARCGGCQLQHVDYSFQVELKRGSVLDALSHEKIGLPADIRTFPAADPFDYRWRGEFHIVRHEGEAVSLGFNEHHRWTAVPISDCLIHHPTIRRSIPDLLELARESTGRLSTLHVTAGEEGRELLVAARPEGSVPASAMAERGTRETAFRWSLSGTTLSWRDWSFRIAPSTFIQVNWTMMDTLYSCVLDEVDRRMPSRVVDAYAGIGVLSTAIAARGIPVTCIESYGPSVALGRLNAEMNDVSDRIAYIPGSTEDELRGQLGGDDPLVIVDPPRSGCDDRVTSLLSMSPVSSIVYVSCNPSTLARDLHVLSHLGPYELTRLDIVDMFPQTYHVETVAHLAVRKGLP